MFKDIKLLLLKTIKRAGITKQVQTVEILKLFQEETSKILPLSLTGKIKPLYIKNNIITVASLSSPAVQELKSKETQIIKEINKISGEEVIREIRHLTWPRSF